MSAVKKGEFVVVVLLPAVLDEHVHLHGFGNALIALVVVLNLPELVAAFFHDELRKNNCKIVVRSVGDAELGILFDYDLLKNPFQGCLLKQPRPDCAFDRPKGHFNLVVEHFLHLNNISDTFLVVLFDRVMAAGAGLRV